MELPVEVNWISHKRNKHRKYGCTLWYMMNKQQICISCEKEFTRRKKLKVHENNTHERKNF